ncbi:TfuA-like protein [Devosia sp.]|uniref:TfuA-like protein n=1 Tax=Devosia sp. TaxID=1871048 RepID=UPI003A92E175
MKTLFAGPSLYGQTLDPAGLDLRPPARQGDLYRAVMDGATGIGLVDGVFGFIPSVWHKEILFALSQGVTVLGAASIGALRVAECHAFGMIPVGEIAADYVTGRRDDDADVCLAHGPAELGYVPLSEPLVDIEATLRAMAAAGHISPAEALNLAAAARRLYFTDRELGAVLEHAGWPETDRNRVLEGYESCRVRLKQRDTLELVARLRALPDRRGPRPGWQFVASEPWRNFLAASTPA